MDGVVTMDPRTVAAVTVGRSDYGVYLPVLRAIRNSADLRLSLIVSGTHLVSGFGHTLDDILADGFEVSERVNALLASDAPESISQSMGLAIIGFAQALERRRPNLLLVLGDRFEMHAAALAALPLKIPVAHIHGGELTAGAIDDALRHSLTKLSHLHFVATEDAARRVAQLGEEPWRITVAGAPALDNLRELPVLTRAEVEEQCGVRLSPAPLLVTFHPVTLEYEQVETQVSALLAALAQIALPIVFTMPNADTRNGVIRQKVLEFAGRHGATWVVETLGVRRYFNLMRYCAAMVGNSSSGLIEAPSLQLPVVNVGSRQAGRLRGANVIDVPCATAPIVEGIRRAVSPDFRAALASQLNPYGDGHAAGRIVEKLLNVTLDDRLVKKAFYDLPVVC